MFIVNGFVRGGCSVVRCYCKRRWRLCIVICKVSANSNISSYRTVGFYSSLSRFRESPD